MCQHKKLSNKQLQTFIMKYPELYKTFQTNFMEFPFGLHLTDER